LALAISTNRCIGRKTARAPRAVFFRPPPPLPVARARCAIIVEQHRHTPHQSHFAKSANPYNPVFKNRLATLKKLCGGVLAARQQQID